VKDAAKKPGMPPRPTVEDREPRYNDREPRYNDGGKGSDREPQQSRQNDGGKGFGGRGFAGGGRGGFGGKGGGHGGRGGGKGDRGGYDDGRPDFRAPREEKAKKYEDVDMPKEVPVAAELFARVLFFMLSSFRKKSNWISETWTFEYSTCECQCWFGLVYYCSAIT
jgi:hypothetical protein